MMPVMECVPNFSEGRDESVIRDLVSGIESEGAEVLDWSMDPDHHRSVVTFVGSPEQVEAAAIVALAAQGKPLRNVVNGVTSPPSYAAIKI